MLYPKICDAEEASQIRSSFLPMDDNIIRTCGVYVQCEDLILFIVVYISADILPVEQQILVGRPYKILCPVFASSKLNLTFMWTGPNGVITDDGRQTIVTDISNDNTTSTSSVQFAYLREDDEGSYRCDVIIFGYNYNYSTSLSVEFSDFTGTYLSS